MIHRDNIDIGIPADERELWTFASYVSHAFADRPQANPEPGWMTKQGIDQFRMVRVGGQVGGGLGLLPMGQWFGGKCVPMTGLAAVVIAPEYRSSGIGSRLIRNALDEMREGFPLSALYPATQAFYRRFGYEQAGVAMHYEIPLHALPAGQRDLGARALNEGEEPIMRDLYSRRAQRTAGNLDRHPMIWEWLLREDGPVSCYVVERDGVPEGYIAYHQIRRPGEQARNIVARDFVALTPDAGRRLLAFLSDHRGVADNLVWAGSPTEPLLFHLPEQRYKVPAYEQWLLRLVDVEAALQARGYPQPLSAQLHLEIVDDVLPWNSGRLLLTVEDGTAEVRKGGTGQIRIDVRGLATIYSGYLAPSALRSTGYIEGSEADLAMMGLLFSGDTPWMPDHF